MLGKGLGKRGQPRKREKSRVKWRGLIVGERGRVMIEGKGGLGEKEEINGGENGSINVVKKKKGYMYIKKPKYNREGLG